MIILIDERSQTITLPPIQTPHPKHIYIIYYLTISAIVHCCCLCVEPDVQALG